MRVEYTVPRCTATARKIDVLVFFKVGCGFLVLKTDTELVRNGNTVDFDILKVVTPHKRRSSI